MPSEQYGFRPHPERGNQLPILRRSERFQPTVGLVKLHFRKGWNYGRAIVEGGAKELNDSIPAGRGRRVCGQAEIYLRDKGVRPPSYQI